MPRQPSTKSVNKETKAVKALRAKAEAGLSAKSKSTQGSRASTILLARRARARNVENATKARAFLAEEEARKAMEKEDTDGQHRPTSPSSCQTWDGECSTPPFNDYPQ